MIRSMTGFGQAEETASGWHCRVEMRSVNGRHSDIRLRLPAGMAHLEETYKKRIKAACERGKVEVSLTLTPEGGGEGALRLNRPLLNTYGALLKEMETALGRPVQVSLGDLLSNRELIQFNSWEAEQEAVEELTGRTVESALADLQSMRETEGASLREALLEHVTRMRELTATMRPLVADLPAQYATRLRENLDRLGNGDAVNDDRIAQEITLFAERSDVTEEFTRLDTHFDHLESLLDQGGAVGKKIDFLLQEMNRETNTLGVKCANAQVSISVIELKSTIEKLREQIQNIV